MLEKRSCKRLSYKLLDAIFMAKCNEICACYEDAFLHVLNLGVLSCRKYGLPFLKCVCNYLAAPTAPNDHNFRLRVSEHRHGPTLRGNQVTSGGLVTTWILKDHIFVSSYTFWQMLKVSDIRSIALLSVHGSVSLKAVSKICSCIFFHIFF